MSWGATKAGEKQRTVKTVKTRRDANRPADVGTLLVNRVSINARENYRGNETNDSEN